MQVSLHIDFNYYASIITYSFFLSILKNRTISVLLGGGCE